MKRIISGGAITIILVTGIIVFAYTRQINHIQGPQPEIFNKPDPIAITLFFPDLNKYRTGTEPYEVAVTRLVYTEDKKQAVLAELIKGPTIAEQQEGLNMIYNHVTSASMAIDSEGTARVYLAGECNSEGATYTIGNILVKNLTQFSDIKKVRIYDQNGSTLSAENEPGNSFPGCLQP